MNSLEALGERGEQTHDAAGVDADVDVDLKKRRGHGKTKNDGGSAWHVFAVMFTVLFNGVIAARLLQRWRDDLTLMQPVAENWPATPWLVCEVIGMLMIFWSYRVVIRASPGRVPPRWVRSPG
jgi:hypothetical protein